VLPGPEKPYPQVDPKCSEACLTKILYTANLNFTNFGLYIYIKKRFSWGKRDILSKLNEKRNTFLKESTITVIKNSERTMY
jgi:hypothetical protein